MGKMMRCLLILLLVTMLAGCQNGPVCIHRYGPLQEAVSPDFLHEGQVAHYVCQQCGGSFDTEKSPLDSVTLPRLSCELQLWIQDTAFPLKLEAASDRSILWSAQGLSVAAGDRITVRDGSDSQILYSFTGKGNLDSQGVIRESRVQVSVTLQATAQGLALEVAEGKYPGLVALIDGQEFPMADRKILCELQPGSLVWIVDNLSGLRYGYESLAETQRWNRFDYEPGDDGEFLVKRQGEYCLELDGEQVYFSGCFAPAEGQNFSVVVNGKHYYAMEKNGEEYRWLQYLEQGSRFYLRQTDTGRNITATHLTRVMGGSDLLTQEEREVTILKGGTYQISYTPASDTFSLTLVYEGTLKNAAFQFDKRIAQIPSGLEQYREEEIRTLYEEYLALPEQIKSRLALVEKLETLRQNAASWQDTTGLILYLNTPETDQVYLSRQELFTGFYTDFYYYIRLYHGTENLRQWDVKNVDDFLVLAQSYYGAGMKNLYGIGFAAGDYFLESRRNYPLECQSDDGFFGFCYENGMYEELLPFLIRFFAYWRIDEGYANRTNPGADIFAEAWAPTVDIAKFFYYDAYDSYVQTDRVLDCFNDTAGVVSLSTDPLPKPSLRGYRFAGWYEDPEFTGELVTKLPQGETVRLYARWLPDEDRRDQDAAALVDVYIYNLTTNVASRNEKTVGYAKAAYDALPETAKELVEGADTLLNMAKQYQ